MKLTFDPRTHWNPTYQLIQPNLKAPIESQGDILENTGLLLAYWSLTKPDQFYKKVVRGLEGLKFSGGLALTKYTGLYEPEESTPGRWIGEGGYWYRQDVSQAQAWYICFGLYMIHEATGYQKAKELLDWYTNYIVNNGYKVGTTSKGNFLGFPPLGNHLLRALSVSGFIQASYPSSRAKWSLRLLSFWTYLYARIGRYGHTDLNNTSFVLYCLKKQGLSKAHNQWIRKKKVKQNLVWLKNRYDGNTVGNPDVIQNDTKYLIRMQIIL